MSNVRRISRELAARGRSPPRVPRRPQALPGTADRSAARSTPCREARSTEACCDSFNGAAPSRLTRRRWSARHRRWPPSFPRRAVHKRVARRGVRAGRRLPSAPSRRRVAASADGAVRAEAGRIAGAPFRSLRMMRVVPAWRPFPASRLTEEAPRALARSSFAAPSAHAAKRADDRTERHIKRPRKRAGRARPPPAVRRARPRYLPPVQLSALTLRAEGENLVAMVTRLLVGHPSSAWRASTLRSRDGGRPARR